jgi:hypothetical protein
MKIETRSGDVAVLRPIAERWKRGETPTENEEQEVYDRLPALLELLEDCEDMIRRRLWRRLFA